MAAGGSPSPLHSLLEHKESITGPSVLAAVQEAYAARGEAGLGDCAWLRGFVRVVREVRKQRGGGVACLRPVLAWAVKQQVPGVAELSLQQAIQRRDVELLRTVAQCGYDVGRWRDEDGKSVLELAVGGGDMAMVRALYDVRCELGAGDVWAGRGGEEVLLAAAAQKEPDPAFLLQLLQCGVSINCQDGHGHTPLLRACQRANHHKRLVKTLLEHGADVQHRDHEGNSALHVACQRNRHEVVEVLLGAGAEVDARNKHGTTPVMLAAALAKNHALLLLLREGADANAVDSLGVTPLIAAIKNSRGHNIKILVGAGARVHELTQHLLQALRAHPKHLYAVVYPALINLHIRNIPLSDLARQFLVLALETGHVGLAQTLIRFGVKPNVTTSDGKTPFAVAINRKWSSLALTLLRYGAQQETSGQYDQEGTKDDHETKDDGQESTEIGQERAKKDGPERAKEDGPEKAKGDGQERAKEDGQERTKDDSQERTKDDSQERTKDDSQERTKGDCQERTKHDGQERTKEDGQERAKEDGQERTKEDGEETAKEDCQERAKDGQERAKEDGQERVKEHGQERAKEHGQERAKEHGQERTKEDGQERTKDDSQERTKEDGQERTKKDGQERAKEDGQERTQKDGQERAKEDGQERTKEDGQERTKDDGHERTKEDGQERIQKYALERMQEFEQSIRLSAEEELRGCSLSQIMALGNVELLQERLRLSSVGVTGPEGDRAVHAAVGNEDVMRCLLDAGADANARDVDGDTPLHRVTGLYMCKLLLQHGARVNATNAHAQTPLLAILRRRFEDVGKVIPFLVAQGADVLQQDDEGRGAVAQCVLKNAPSFLASMLDSLPHPPALLPQMLTELLAEALDSGRYKCARVLVQHGAGPELVQERVGLYTAIQHGLATRELVARRQGEVNEKGQGGVTPLMMACRQGQLDLVQALLEHGAAVDETDDEGATALFYCIDEDIGIIVAKTVLQAGANPNHRRQWLKWHKAGVTPLMMACSKGQVDLVQALLEHGAAVDETDDEGATALFYCTTLIVTRLVLQAGANPNHSNKEGDYPYSRRTVIAVLQELLQAGADINRQDRSYFTPLLIHAVNYGQNALVQYLLTNPVREADPNIVNHAGVSALSVACSRGYQGIVALLLEHGADCSLGPAPLLQAFDHPHIVRMLLQHKCDPNQQNSYGETLLVRAAHCTDSDHRMDILDILAECPGVDVDARDEHGRTVLHLALARKSYLAPLVPFLLQRQARLDTMDACHRSILHDWQPRTDSLAQLALGEVLRQSVDVNQQDYSGHTPMHLAVLEPNVRLRRIKCRKLLSFGADLSIGDKNGLTVYHLAAHDPQLFHNLMQHAPCEFPAASRDLLLNLSRHFQTEASIRAVLRDIQCPPVLPSSEKIANVTFSGAYGLAEWSADMMADIASKGHQNFLSQMLHNEVLCAYPHDQMAEMQEKAETVLALFRDISAEVAKYDAMLAFTPFISGSCNEGTKVLAPDEMDMLCVLHGFTGLRFSEQQKFPSLVRIYQDTPYPPFTGPEYNLMIQSQVFSHFYHAFGHAIQSSAIWQKYPRLYRLRMDDMSDSNQAISDLALVWHGHHFPFLEFSVDVVPAFSGGAWLPDGSRDHPLLHRNGILVIPKFRIEYITKTDVTELFQLSFERSEADLFHMMPVELKQAYMLAKIVKTKIPKIELLPAGMFVSSYLLKTCTFSLFHDHPEYQQRLDAFLATAGASAALSTPPYDPHPLAPAPDVIYWCRQLFLRLHQAMGTRSLPSFFLPAYNLLSHRVYVENYRPQLVARIGRTLLLDPEAEAEAWRGLAEEQPWRIAEVDPDALLMDVPAPCNCTRKFFCTKKHAVRK